MSAIIKFRIAPNPKYRVLRNEFKQIMTYRTRDAAHRAAEAFKKKYKDFYYRVEDATWG